MHSVGVEDLIGSACVVGLVRGVVYVFRQCVCRVGVEVLGLSACVSGFVRSAVCVGQCARVMLRVRVTVR